MTQSRLLNRTEAAAYLGISPRHFDRICEPLPAIYLGRSVRWDRDDLDALIVRLKNEGARVPVGGDTTCERQTPTGSNEPRTATGTYGSRRGPVRLLRPVQQETK